MFIFFLILSIFADNTNYYNTHIKNIEDTKSLQIKLCYNLPTKINLESILINIIPDFIFYKKQNSMPYFEFKNKQNSLFIHYSYGYINYLYIIDGLNVFKYKNHHIKSIHTYDINNTIKITTNINEMAKSHNYKTLNALKYIKNSIRDEEDLFNITQVDLISIKKSNIILQIIWYINNNKYEIKIDPYNNDAFFKNMLISQNNFTLYPVDVNNIDRLKTEKNKIYLKRKSNIYSPSKGIILTKDKNKITILNNNFLDLITIDNITISNKIYTSKIIEQGDIIGYSKDFIYYKIDQL